MRRALRGLPIFWATLLLLLAALFATQMISVALFVFVGPPRPDFNRLSDLADALAGRDHERGGRERALSVTTRPVPPRAGEDMTSDPRFTARLARRGGGAPDRVLLFFEPDQRADLPQGRRPRRLVPMRRGEPLFFDTVVAAVDTGQGWRVVQTPPRPWLAAWQRRVFWWFAASALMLVPFAWLFARRLTRPISRFAAAADRMGGDPLGPRVPEDGPAELRVTAHALNRMQDRLETYVAERTAMIGAIAHDLRTPLARIAFRIEAAPEPVRDKVQADIEQMRAMIAATIGFVRGTTLAQAGPVALDALVTRMAEAEQEMGRPVRLGPVAPLTVSGDALALQRLVQNLIDNGVAYGGAVALSLDREDGEAVLRVADEGPGVPADRLEALFEPFRRGDPSRNRDTGGIGLGLTIARSIAQGHGGTLTLRNRPGGGLAADFRLPLATSDR
ncbi:ATP-binding protein [Sphingomonas solaris]|uniref:histidine kinase n=1 Tax=Alterirhizorhabdus solaris TaxID=2529389 RepID=A0A558R0G1_9SPHN|nr:ATP-binding protein [Sphingomonas solaris]TVV72875.1 HAMP domain-containing protein [Sphingomonas solaris]